VPLAARGVLDLRSADAEHVIALFSPILIAHFARAPEDRELALLRSLVEQARAEGLRGGMLFVIARRNATGGIQPRVRAFFEQMVRENAGQFGASAAVILMRGFGASLMRSFLTGLLVLTNRRRALQIFATVDEACRWLAPQHGLDPQALLASYQQATVNIVHQQL
jgi:hypothetical protein